MKRAGIIISCRIQTDTFAGCAVLLIGVQKYPFAAASLAFSVSV